MFYVFFSSDSFVEYEILNLFPFSSESKRMGIIVRDYSSKRIIFYVKGADTVMSSLVSYVDWLEDEAGNLAREGLRTLVVASRTLTEEQYSDFAQRYTYIFLVFIVFHFIFHIYLKLHIFMCLFHAVIYTIISICTAIALVNSTTTDLCLLIVR